MAWACSLFFFSSGRFSVCCQLLYLHTSGNYLWLWFRLSLQSSVFNIFWHYCRRKRGEQHKSNRNVLRRHDVCFQNFKCALIVLIGLVLDIIKFDSSQPVQALKVQNALGIILIVGVALSLAVSISFSLIMKKVEH